MYQHKDTFQPSNCRAARYTWHSSVATEDGTLSFLVSVNTTSSIWKSLWSAAHTTYKEWIKSKRDLLWAMRLFKYFRIKYISHIYSSYTNVRKGHPRACTVERSTCLIFFFLKKKHVWIQSEGRSWLLPYRCEATFGPFYEYMYYHTLSLHNKPAVYKPGLTSLDQLATSVKTSYTMTTDGDNKKSLWNEHLSNGSNLPATLFQLTSRLSLVVLWNRLQSLMPSD